MVFCCRNSSFGSDHHVKCVCDDRHLKPSCFVYHSVDELGRKELVDLDHIKTDFLFSFNDFSAFFGRAKRNVTSKSAASGRSIFRRSRSQPSSSGPQSRAANLSHPYSVSLSHGPVVIAEDLDIWTACNPKMQVKFTSEVF